MEKINYYNKFILETEALKNSNKANLLLHCCCAPCASSVIETLNKHFNVTAYFYNPNIDGEQEYFKRAEELKRLCEFYKINCIIAPFIKQEFLANISGLEKEREGGARCEKCFHLRLKNTAEYAKNYGFNAFCTSLTVSPLKNASLINKIGKEIESEVLISYLTSDFKKKDGYKRSIELSFKHGLYRQNYCGCEFSKKGIE